MREIDLTARSEESRRDLLRPAALAIREGDLAIVPTTTYYALAADALNATAVRRVFSAKKRDPGKPLIVLVDSFGMARLLTGPVDSRAKELDWRFGAKGLTYVLPAARGLPTELTAGGETIAFRVERNEILQDLLSLTETPITGPSANPEGAPPPTRLEDAVAPLRDWVEVAVRWHATGATAPSTIVDLTRSAPRILREGSVAAEDVLRALGCDG
jgi:L-threonylcarbamoyladenylate synthase